MSSLGQHWLDAVQTIGIVASIYFAIRAARDQARQLRIANSFMITQHHRDLWGYMLDHSDLQRIFDPTVDTVAAPVTERERTFINLLFLHSAACLKAIRTGAVSPVHGIEADIKDILSHPLPYAVWLDVEPFHDRDFALFVEGVRRGLGSKALP